MARDFPETSTDFKVQKDQRTFAENLLHVAAVDYDPHQQGFRLNLGPDFGKDKPQSVPGRLQDKSRRRETH